MLDYRTGARRAALLLMLLAAARTPAAAQPPATPPSPLRLDAALQYAADHYPAVVAAVEQANAAGAQVQAARAAYLPRLDAVMQVNRATVGNVFGQLLPQSVIPSMSGPVVPTTVGTSVWGTAAGALATWETWDFGLRAATVREAEINDGRARTVLTLTVHEAQAAVGSAFLAVVAADAAATSAFADVERRETLARTVHTLADNELRPGADASRADAELAAARTRAVQATQAARMARTMLSRLLGVQDASLVLDAAPLLQAAPSALPAEAPLSMQGHPLAMASRANVDVAEARERVLAHADRPKLLVQSALFARGTGARPDGTTEGGSGGLGFDRANWAAGVQLVFPNLFDGPSMRARRASAAAASRAERARLEDAMLSVWAGRENASAAVEAAQEIARNTPVQVNAARQAEAQARARYDAGLAGLVDVADAQNLLAAAEYQDAAARVDVWRAWLAYGVAQGTLTSFSDRVRSAGAR